VEEEEELLEIWKVDGRGRWWRRELDGRWAWLGEVGVRNAHVYVFVWRRRRSSPIRAQDE
jgi:hypothetical protein